MLFTCAGAGGVFGPWIIGRVSDAFGLHAGFSMNLIFAILMTAAIFVLMKGKHHESTPA
jgi:FHS family glucose/mannose:H+ symporter-like MFS transporter